MTHKTRGWRSALRPLAAAAAACLAAVLIVEALAWSAWGLVGAGATRPSGGGAPVPKTASAFHQVGEWPDDRPRTFREAPLITRLRRAGRLTCPDVADRLPVNPLVITPPQQAGPYGGTWTAFGTGPDDVGVYFWARIAYEGLVRWDPMGVRQLPNLAMSWTASPDGREYTFNLRKGVRWSDGHPWTADDILFWHDAVLANKELVPTPPDDFSRGGDPVQVEKVGDYIVRFRFREPHGTFIAALASMGDFRRVDLAGFPRHYLSQFHPDYTPRDQLEEIAKKHGFDSWTKFFDDRFEWSNPECPRLWAWVLTKPPPSNPVVFERNPDYWKVDTSGNQLPYIDRLAVQQVFDSETMQLKFITGEIGMQGRHVDIEKYPLLMKNRNNPNNPYRVYHWIGGASNSLMPNLNHKDPVLKQLFHDIRFRRALSLAINRQLVNKICFHGMGTPRQSCPPPQSPFYDPRFETEYMEYDPEQANRLLDEMMLRRWRDGFRLRPDGKPLAITIVTMGKGNAENLVVRFWQAVGIKADFKQVGRDTMFLAVRGMNHDVAFWAGGGAAQSIADAVGFAPQGASASYAYGYGLWYLSGRRQEIGDIPPRDMIRCYDLFDEIRRSADAAKQNTMFREMLDIHRKNLWYMGLVGKLPSLMLVNNRFRNVPEVAVDSWTCRTPGNTAPECYAIMEK